MKLQKLIIKGFRCFSDHGTTIEFEDNTTMLVGPNGTGKTAALAALARMFGAQGRGRGLLRTDFNSQLEVPTNGTRNLSIEAWFTFSELEKDDADHSAVSDILEDLTFESEHGMCLRARLTGELHPDGQIDEQLLAIRTVADVPAANETARFGGVQRNAIQVIYVPATRDPSRELATSTSAIIGRLLRALKRGDEWALQAKTASEAVSGVIAGHKAVEHINVALEKTWSRLYKGRFLKEPRLGFSPVAVDDLLDQARVLFSPDHGEPADVGQLSDGQRSLFFLTLIDVACTLEREMRAQEDSDLFDIDRIRPPAFTLIAFEEPENHLATHFLGRVLRVIEQFSARPNAQALIATHAPGLAGRIRPEAIRHFRLETDRTVAVSPLNLPRSDSEAYMILKETLWAYPELLFSRVVVLCEGDSEQLVLPRLFAAHADPPAPGTGKIAIPYEIDDSFISVAPLDGRHTNHYWKLLHGLRVPFVTLLDLDLGRAGAGMERIKTAYENIKLFHHCDETKAKAERRLKQISTLPVTLRDPRKAAVPEGAQGWIEDLEELGVFFSAPLDLDLMMLEAFSAEYKMLGPGEQGPEEVKGATELDSLLKAILGPGKAKTSDRAKTSGLPDQAKHKDDRLEGYSADQRKLLAWYRYRFLSGQKGKGKPVAHLNALARLSPERLRDESPGVLKRLVQRVREFAAALTE